MRLLLAVVCLSLSAVPAVAQERSASERQTIVLLAYVLGEAHGVDQVCEGPGALRWRRRMQRLTELEQPDQAFAGRLNGSFNEGFEYRRAQHPACDAAARAAAAETARRGAELSRSIVAASGALAAPVAGETDLR